MLEAAIEPASAVLPSRNRRLTLSNSGAVANKRVLGPGLSQPCGHSFTISAEVRVRICLRCQEGSGVQSFMDDGKTGVVARGM
jgi:hypothetical protein